MEELKYKTPFHCIITGPKNCGKTQYLVNTLKNSYRYVFEYIILICPNYVENLTYRGFAKKDPRFIVLSPKADDVNEICDLLSMCKTLFSGNDTLIILDDCAFSKELKQRSNDFIRMGLSGRHDKISIWFLTQQITSIAKPFRENVACIVSFYSPSQSSNRILFEEFGWGMDIEDRNAFMKILKQEKYSRICFCLIHPHPSYVEIPGLSIC